MTKHLYRDTYHYTGVDGEAERPDHEAWCGAMETGRWDGKLETMTSDRAKVTCQKCLSRQAIGHAINKDLEEDCHKHGGAP